MQENRIVVIQVRGTPKPQPRPRFVRGRVISTADPATRAWKDGITRAAHAAVMQHGKLDGALRVEATVFMPTKDKARWGKPHELRPDRDNLDKAMLDAITAGGLWGDDCQVSAGGTRKVWCQPGQQGAVITVGPDSSAGVSPPWAGEEPPVWLRE